MKKVTKNVTAVISLGAIGVLLFQFLSWKSPQVNFSARSDIHSCIHEDESKLKFNFQVTKDTGFEVLLVRNSKPNCVNPYFPAIHVKTAASHNAWLHIVYTDSKAPEWQIFIDSTVTKPSPYPFYTFEADFYDAPLWTYYLFYKPISFWKWHAFAVEVNHNNKTIKILGGIEWGFELRFMKLYPIAIEPRLLDEKAWKQAWKLVKGSLPDYQFLE